MPKILSRTRSQIIDLIEQGSIPPDKISAALDVSQLRPNLGDWRRFIDNLLLCLGVLMLVFAVVFFIAYNWNDLGRFAKFALVQVFILLAIFAYGKWGKPLLLGQLALLVASIAVGVLLALYGQTYQTGADPWQLFFNWALLILPWTLIARFPPLWLLWLTLLNLSCILYYQVFRGLFSTLFSATELLWLILSINSAALIIWELLARKLPWLNESWAIRLVAVSCGIPATWLALHAIFDDEVSALTALFWAIFTAALFFYYRKIKTDLFMLAGGCLSGIVVLTCLIGKAIFEADADGGGGFLLLAFVVIGLSTGAAVWLRQVHKEMLA